MERSNIIEMLSNNVVNVEFIKADGSVRKMLATRDNSIIPTEHQPKAQVADAPVKTENLNIVKCFDLEAKGWRSFKVASLTSASLQS